MNSKTVDAKHTIPKVCDWNAWPNACAHYHSAIHADVGRLGKSRFTCEDDNARVNQDYTNDWAKQHNSVWRKFQNPDYIFPGVHGKHEERDLECQADEWPPAFFVPKSEAGRPEWGQKIRWIPREENGGAASLWRGFCSANDGGKGNGQRVRPEKGSPADIDRLPINKELL